MTENQIIVLQRLNKLYIKRIKELEEELRELNLEYRASHEYD